MRKLLIACFLSILCVPAVKAQQSFYQPDNRFKGPMSIGTGHAPQTGAAVDVSPDTTKHWEIVFPIIKDTNVAPKIKGGLFIDAADSNRLYFYNGIKFKKVGT